MTIFTRPQWCIEPLRPHADAEVKRRDDSPGARFRNAGASEHLVNATPSAMTWIVHSSGGRSTA
jgi:hypothetical protein